MRPDCPYRMGAPSSEGDFIIIGNVIRCEKCGYSFFPENGPPCENPNGAKKD